MALINATKMFESTVRDKKPKLKPLSAEDLQKAVAADIAQAIDFVETTVSQIRITADKYYQGETAIKPVPGRSKVIVTKVRDAIRSVIPAVGRVFTQNDVIAEFTSDDEEDERICQDQTLFVNSVYNKFGGYKALIHACTDALKARVGVVKVSLEKVKVGSSQLSKALTQEELAQLEDDDAVQVTEVAEFMPSPEDGIPRAEVMMTRYAIRNMWHLDPAPPESFFIDPNATSCDDFRTIGIAQNMTVSEAIALGLEYADIVQYANSRAETQDAERDSRQTKLVSDKDYESESVDPMAKQIFICEAWMKIDADGDGIAELRHFITAGQKYVIVHDEPCNYHQLAVFSAELQPHVFFPICLAEDMMQDQDSQTVLLRSILDNAALVNSPRTEVNEVSVNLEDVKNNEIGSIIRVKQMGQINELVTPFVAGQTLTVLEYLSQVSEQRSGITKLSQGIDPNALQSTSRIAANAAVQGSDARIEMMVRNLGETGVVSMFLAILRIAMYELQGEQSVKTSTGYKEVHPDKWHDQVNVSVNVGLGNGRIDEKMMALQGIATVQQTTMQMLGLANPICGWPQFRNTVKQMLRLSGIKNVSEYFPNVPIEKLAELDKQMAASKQAPDPSAGLVEAEKVKATAAIQINDKKIAAQQQADAAKIQVQTGSDIQKLQVNAGTTMAVETMKDDRERDAQAQNYAVAAYKVAMDKQTKIEVAKEVAKKRTPDGSSTAT